MVTNNSEVEEIPEELTISLIHIPSVLRHTLLFRPVEPGDHLCIITPYNMHPAFIFQRHSVSHRVELRHKPETRATKTPFKIKPGTFLTFVQVCTSSSVNISLEPN